MPITFDMWHDGTGYDLDALRQLPEQEQSAIEKILIDHHPRDWRDIEALAMFDSPAAAREIEAAANSADPQVRREALRHAPQKSDPRQREEIVIHSLRGDSLVSGLGVVLDEVAEFHPPGVIDALFDGALKRDGEAAVHFAAMLFYLHGKSSEPFDWAQRPFFLRFHTTDRAERQKAFEELCRIVGADPQKYTGHGA
jgi:hypothetical protein